LSWSKPEERRRGGGERKERKKVYAKYKILLSRVDVGKGGGKRKGRGKKPFANK